jgi:hypothetical protein
MFGIKRISQTAIVLWAVNILGRCTNVRFSPNSDQIAASH